MAAPSRSRAACPTQFPDRVLTTPISEAGIVAVATGLALRGYSPGGRDHVRRFPVSRRRPDRQSRRKIPRDVQRPGPRAAGHPHARWAAGAATGRPTAKAWKSIFSAFPACGWWRRIRSVDPGRLLRQAIFDVDDPVLFVENKIGYGEPLLRERAGLRHGPARRRGRRPSRPSGSSRARRRTACSCATAE